MEEDSGGGGRCFATAIRGSGVQISVGAWGELWWLGLGVGSSPADMECGTGQGLSTRSVGRGGRASQPRFVVL
jgi:hypothetical protein